MSLPSALRQQAEACAALGSPFMGRLLTGLAEAWPQDSALAAACARFAGDVGPGGASLPLRIASGLHALVLGGRDAALAAAYPPNEADDAALLRAALDAIERHSAFLIDWIASPPQTNEVRRSVALIAAAQVIAARHPLPFILSELGASAGLNLMFDRYALRAGGMRFGPEAPALTLEPDWTGPVPAPAPVEVAERAGVDLSPIDARAPEAARRLLSYLWPDQPRRAELTRAAIAVQDVRVERGDAIDWLAPRLACQAEGRVHLVYHTIAWQYFPPETQAGGKALIEAAGARARETCPLAWLAMEADGRSPGALLTLRLWPDGTERALARVDFHGRWVDWGGDGA